jgi:hypothetical protein
MASHTFASLSRPRSATIHAPSKLTINDRRKRIKRIEDPRASDRLFDRAAILAALGAICCTCVVAT